MKALEQIANEDQVTFAGVFSDIETRGIDRVKSEVLSYLKLNYSLKKVLQFHTMPTILGADITPTGKWVGFTMQTVFEASEMLSLYIQELSIYSSTPTTGTPIKIIDIASKKELWSTTKDLTAGWNRIYLNRSFESEGLFVCYQDTGVGVKGLTIYDNNSMSSCNCYFDNLGSCRIFVNGATTTDIEALDLDLGSNTYGVSATIALQCNFEKFICSNREMFTLPLLYAIGNEFALERIYSNRVNPYTTLDKKQAQDLNKYLDETFLKEIDLACRSIRMETDVCVECLDLVTDKWMHP